MSITPALAEAYASAPADEVVFDTLEIRHPSFVDDAGQPTAIRVVIGYEDIEARLEPQAPLHGGQYVTFIAGAFKFTLPGFEEGQVPQLKITLDGVNRQITEHLEASRASKTPIEVTYRPYLSGDLTAPQMDPPINMVLDTVDVDVFQSTGTASMNDVHNWPYPKELYTPERFPGLVR